VVTQEFHFRRKTLKSVSRAIRCEQWIKNVLLFVPAIAAHQLLVPSVIVPTILGFICFCLIASSAYLVNDLMDLPADRHHPVKRLRPFAAGDLAPAVGALLLIPCIITPAILAWLFLPVAFASVLGGYLVVTLAYSFHLKKQLLLDVVVLAGLYSLRIMAGGAAAGVFLSPWLLAFSIFVFLSLALVKRVSELRNIRDRGDSTIRRRAYLPGDLEALSVMGVASGYASCFILALYMDSSEVLRQYHNPRWLWLICPLAIYWISRVWLLAHRGEVTEDPLVFAARDKASYVMLLFACVVLILAI
jgi:4-hydroxybenzoate polyprenyltransferase